MIHAIRIDEAQVGKRYRWWNLPNQRPFTVMGPSDDGMIWIRHDAGDKMRVWPWEPVKESQE